MLHKLFIFLSLLLLPFIECNLKISRVNPNDTQYYKFNMVKDVKPIRYYIDISLDPIRNFQYYNGTSKIVFQSTVKSNFIAFHLKLTHLIDIHKISLVNLKTAQILTNFNVTYFEHGDDPLIGLESIGEQFLEEDTIYSLNIGYTIRFDEGKRKGFFKFCDKLNGSENNCFSTTHFETHNIRLAFPSFDNATLKARFNIRVKHRSDMIACSNMPGRIVEDAGDTVTTLFDESPPMSTYLLAIAIGNFERTPIKNFSNLTMNFYTPVGIEKSNTILEKYAGQFVFALETYLNMRFPLTKLDFFASYSAADSIQGMEHWGFISFDGNVILETNKLTDFENIENTIKVIAHEIVHQYFGNLVSLKELNSLWLKEGLTTYFTSRVSAAVFPEENYNERMFLTDFVYAMVIEGVLNSGVAINNYEILITPNILKPMQQVYVIYTKGSVFTNMIANVLGENAFQKFIQNLIHNFEYDSISTEDFINELQFVNDMDHIIPENIDISGFVNSWINQPKFPIVTVTRNYDSGVVEIKQDSTEHTFWIPFNYATKSNPNFNVTTPDGWLRNVPAMNVTVKNLKPNDWILFNKHAIGYYIVNYDAQNWNLIIDALLSDNGFHVIPPLNRAKLILDVAILYQQGLLSDDNILFRIINLLKHEDNYITWSIVKDYFPPDFKLYLVDNIDDLIGHFYRYYGVVHQPTDTRSIKLARTKAIDFACLYKYKKCHHDMSIAATGISKQKENFDNLNIDWAMFKLIFRYGVVNNEQFEAFLRKVNSCKNKKVHEFFYDNLDEKIEITAFQKIFVMTVYELPSRYTINEEDLRFNLDLMDLSNFYDLTILNNCLLANCYDFVAVFPNVTERIEQIYKMVEKVVMNMDTPKFIFDDGNTHFSTIFDVLDNIEKFYGINVKDRIMAKYDINKPPVIRRYMYVND